MNFDLEFIITWVKKKGKWKRKEINKGKIHPRKHKCQAGSLYI